MFNSKGVLTKDNPSLSAMQLLYATDKKPMSLEEALVGADIFLGLSSGDIMTPKMLLGMAENPIVFAMGKPKSRNCIQSCYCHSKRCYYGKQDDLTILIR